MWEEPRYAVVCLKEGELEWLCETSWVVSAQTGRRMEGKMAQQMSQVIFFSL